MKHIARPHTRMADAQLAGSRTSGVGAHCLLGWVVALPAGVAGTCSLLGEVEALFPGVAGVPGMGGHAVRWDGWCACDEWRGGALARCPLG